jgi:hypothetical protein
MHEKPMNRIFLKVKILGGSVLGGLLIFTNWAKAQQSALMPTLTMRPTPEEMLLGLIPFIGGAFFVFVIVPVAGLIWYRKRGGTKKWPRVIVWILAALFALALAALIILLYSEL